jgi:oligopeptide/dipeptide ABC transporter ATP-binding protein
MTAPPLDRIAPEAAPARDLVSIRGLSVDFPTASGRPKRALDSIDLDVKQGEVVGLVGESGAGKTTLARSILGLPPEPGRIAAGTIVFEDRNILALGEPELRALRGKRLSMVVPNPRGELNPVLTVGDQIANMARIHLGADKKKARELALGMLRAVQIPDPVRRMDAYPHELSGGMAQRAVIAIALICSPSFIISDDATSGLDVTVQAQILQLLGALTRQQGSAMLFITRDVGITAHFCDRVAVLYAGQIMEIAPRESLFLNPHHPYTLMLLAAFSHNPALRDAWSVRTGGAKKPAETGCSYAERCPLAQPICRQVRPPLAEVTPGHRARCHFPVMH